MQMHSQTHNQTALTSAAEMPPTNDSALEANEHCLLQKPYQTSDRETADADRSPGKKAPHQPNKQYKKNSGTRKKSAQRSARKDISYICSASKDISYICSASKNISYKCSASKDISYICSASKNISYICSASKDISYICSPLYVAP
jgi:hypothetical protein